MLKLDSLWAIRAWYIIPPYFIFIIIIITVIIKLVTIA